MAKVKKKIKHAVIYARFSSHNQRDVSIDQQIDAALKLAATQNITVTKIYSDRAVSGKTDKRAEFQQMLHDAENGEFQCVLAWKSNRIGRNMLEAMLNEQRLASYGVSVMYVEETFDDSAAGRFAARSMMNVNQFYSESMAEDVIRGMNDNAAKCMLNGKPAYGYKKSPDGKYIIDEAKANTLIEIAERVLNRESFVDIYTDLNARCIPSPTGGKWNRSSFNSILTNERVRGIYIWGDTRIEDGIPRIMSDDMFFRLQEVLKVKNGIKGRHRANGEYLLTGKLFCGYCEKAMIGYSGTGKQGNLYHYYICQTHKYEKNCKKKNVRRDEIERLVAETIRDYALQPDILDWIAEYTVAWAKKNAEESKIPLLNERLKETNKSINNIITAIEQGIFTSTTKDRLLALEEEKSELEAQIEIERGNLISITKEDVIAGLSIYRDGDLNDKKYLSELFHTFLSAVYLFDNELKLTFTFPGNRNTTTVPLSALSETNSSSPKLRIAPPHASYTNPAVIYAIDSTFVLTLTV